MPPDLKADADSFLSTDDFAEKVKYVPRTGRPRVIVAIVDRNPPATITEIPGAKAPVIWLHAKNDQIEGIDPKLLDTGGDRVEVAQRVGGVKAARSITSVVRQDAGMVTLEVR